MASTLDPKCSWPIDNAVKALPSKQAAGEYAYAYGNELLDASSSSCFAIIIILIIIIIILMTA